MFQTTNQMFMPCFTLKNHTFCLKSNWGTPNCKRMMIYLSLIIPSLSPLQLQVAGSANPFSDVNLTSSWVDHGISHEIPQYIFRILRKNASAFPWLLVGFFIPVTHIKGVCFSGPIASTRPVLCIKSCRNLA